MERGGLDIKITFELILWSRSLHDINSKIFVILCFNKKEATIVYPNNCHINTDLVKKWINTARNHDVRAEFIPIKTDLQTGITTSKLQPETKHSEKMFLSGLLNFLTTSYKVFEPLYTEVSEP